MTLSGIGKFLVFLTLVAASGWAGREYAVPVYTYLTEGRSINARDARISKRSITFRIPGDTGVTFAFSQPVTKAKILVHPSVDDELRDLDRGFVYGLRMRWIGADGTELGVQEAYLQADSPDDVFESGQVWRFFRTGAELVAEQDSVIVESVQPATWLEVEAFDLDPGIVGIDVRVFEQRAYIGNQPLLIFGRLSDDSKALLTEPNAFPVDMLTEQERLHLGRNFWRPVGPLGIDGRDYTKLVLYEAAIENDASDDEGRR